MRFIHILGRTNLSQKYIPIVFDTNLKVIIDFANIKRKKNEGIKTICFSVRWRRRSGPTLLYYEI